jgi:carbamoylphosphate synthase small subunit
MISGVGLRRLFISNGPGDPAMCKETIAHIKDAFNDNKPICGICMGNQLLGAAAVHPYINLNTDTGATTSR